MVGPAVAPTQLLAQLGKETLHLMACQRLPPRPILRVEEERSLLPHGLAREVAQPTILMESLYSTDVQGHVPRLGELGPLDRESAGLEVNVEVAQRQRFGDPQTRAGD